MLYCISSKTKIQQSLVILLNLDINVVNQTIIKRNHRHRSLNEKITAYIYIKKLPWKSLMVGSSYTKQNSEEKNIQKDHPMHCI